MRVDYVKESMRSEQLANGFDCGVNVPFPSYRILGIFRRRYWQNELASLSDMITQDGRVRFARSEVGSDGI